MSNNLSKKIDRDCVDKILIPSTSFMRASERLEQFFNSSLTAVEPLGLAIVGESRSGKSRLIDTLMHNHPPKRNEEGLHVPLIKVTTPARPTVKGFVDELLVALGDPVKSERGTENFKTERLKILLKKAGTTLVIVEEFQHFYDRGSRKIQYHLSDYLKNLLEETKVFLVVVGLPNAVHVINQNEQLSGRMFGAIHMQRYSWLNKDSQQEFVGILKGFECGLGEFSLPSTNTDGVAFRFFCASGGLIGYVVKILKQAVWDALDEGRDEISMKHLEDAFNKAIWLENNSQTQNPFSSAFDPTPSKAILQNFSLIGGNAFELQNFSQSTNSTGVSRDSVLVSNRTIGV